MPTLTSTKLVIGRGELYFGRFISGTLESEGELYLGNTPGFSVARDVEEVERFTSYGGQQIKLESHIVRETNAANITTDNIDIENVALWFGGSPDTSGQEAIGTVSETFTVKRGRHYQLGTSHEPFGVRHVEPDIVFEKDGVVIAVEGNIELRREEGRFFVLSDAVAIADGDEIEVTFQWRQSFSQTSEPVPVEVVGSMRFIATNPVGPRKSYFFPYVRLKPSGQIDLKGDQFQQMMFSVDIRRLNPLTNFYYVLEVAAAQYTEDEKAILELGPLLLEAFPGTENLLDQVINTFIPAADYSAPIDYP